MPPASNTARTAFGDGRVSVQRQAIVDSTLDLDGAFTVDELVEAARLRTRGLGTATVYRAVAALEANGWLERVGTRGDSALYLRCPESDRHHHHMICERCGRVQATECPVIPAAVAETSSDGFLITRHEVALYGLCAQCAGTHEKDG